MKWSMAGLGMIFLGLLGIVIIVLFTQLTTNNESDYYLLKEISEAAMIDAIDVTHYRKTGELRIVKEKFVENFIRRFTNSTNVSRNGYTISFYQIMETPPKATVVVNTGLDNYSVEGYLDLDDIRVVNNLSSILEYIPNKVKSITGQNGYSSASMEKDYYFLYVGNNYRNKLYIDIPDELNHPTIKDVELASIDISESMSTQEFINRAYFDTVTNFHQFNDNSVLNDYAFSVDSCGLSKKDVYSVSDSKNHVVDLDVTGNGTCIIAKFKLKWNYKIIDESYG